ncbi:hypothetical protein STEG23_013038 [Scotinomys teguina]
MGKEEEEEKKEKKKIGEREGRGKGKEEKKEKEKKKKIDEVIINIGSQRLSYHYGSNQISDRLTSNVPCGDDSSPTLNGKVLLVRNLITIKYIILPRTETDP